jgi:predicted transcriptional regulator
MAPTTRTVGQGDAQYTEVKQSLSGVPTDLIDKVGEIVDARKQRRPRATKREFYTEAVEAFLSDLRRGEAVEVLSTAKVGTTAQLWLRDDLAEEFAQVCEKLNRRKNVVFATALARWLAASK